MLNLRETQAQFAVAMQGDAPPSLLAEIYGDRKGRADERLAVYRNTVQLGLLSALRITYPITQELVGEEFFAACVAYFVADHFPKAAYLNDYGAEFSDFLRTFEPATILPYLPDVAALEWQIAQSFNAQDVASLSAEAFSQLSEAEQESLRFQPHPVVKRILLHYPAEGIWQAVRNKDDAALADLELRPNPHTVLILRAPHGVTIQTLTDSNERLLHDLLRGVPLSKSLPPDANDTELALFAELLAFNALCPMEISP